MMTRLGAVLAAVLLFSMGAAEAKPTDPSKAEARRHYDAGLAHFNLREYPQAIEEFQAAYRILPDAVFLYNLGQSYRLSNDADQALYFYRTYVRMAPNAPNRSEVDERIATLEKLVAEKRNAERPPDNTLAPTDGRAAAVAASPAASTGATASSASVAHEDRAQGESHPVYKRWWFWTIGAGVVAGVAVGLGVGLGTPKSGSFNANVGTFGPNAITVRF